MNNHKLLAAGIIIAFCAASVGCQQAESTTIPDDPWGQVRVPPGQPIRIRIALSRTDENVGPMAVEQVRGAELAARQSETIQGFVVALDASDPACSSSGGANAANQAIEMTDTVGIVGMTCSSSCVAAAPILEEAHIVGISPSCGASALTDPVSHRDVFFTTGYSANDEGVLSGAFAFNELGARRAAIISYESTETDDIVSAFETQFRAAGGSIVSASSIAPGQFTFRSAFQEAASNKADLIYAPLLPIDAVTLAVQVKDSPMRDTHVLGGRYFLGTWFIDKTGSSSDGLYAVGPSFDNSQYRSVAGVYRNVYGEEPPSAEFAYAYDSMQILLKGIEAVALVDADNNLVIGRKALQEAILQTANFEGITGPITCTNWGDCSAPKTLVVAQAKAQKWVNVFIP